jgi:hypothetical protein
MVLLAILAWASSASAQGYRTDPMDPNAGRNRGIAQSCPKDPATYTANQDKFNDYFLKYHFPAMTRTGPEELADLGKLRKEIFELFLWKTTNEQLQQDLTNLTFTAMRGFVIAKDPPYHPAVRYNAVLIIGMLDKTYAIESGPTRRPPVPLPEATTLLTKIVLSAAQDGPAPPSLVLGAVVGLERHAQYQKSLSPEAVTAMSDALLKLVAHDAPIQEMDRDAYSWLRLRAAGVLAKLGSVGQNNAVHDAIVHLISTSKSLDDRCAAAGLLQKLDYKNVKLDGAKTTEPLFQLTRDLAAAEAERAGKYLDPASGGISPRSVEQFIPVDGSTDQETFPRRHVLARLTDLKNGLTQVKPALPAEDQKKVDAVLAAIKPALTAAANKETVAERLVEAIRGMSEAVDKAIPPATKTADAAQQAF